MSMAKTGKVLVAAQFALIMLVVASGPWLPQGIAGWVVMGAGATLGFWAIAAMSRGRLRVFPEVAPGARLIVSGPYRWIRHPMYSAGMLCMFGLVFDFASPLRLLGFVLLAVVLIAKLRLEEKYLHAAFPDYASYARRTWRLVPHVY